MRNRFTQGFIDEITNVDMATIKKETLADLKNDFILLKIQHILYVEKQPKILF